MNHIYFLNNVCVSRTITILKHDVVIPICGYGNESHLFLDKMSLQLFVHYVLKLSVACCMLQVSVTIYRYKLHVGVTTYMSDL